MKTAVIGDVHGCLDEFVELVNAVKRERGCERVVQLGDLMDRGPHQAACVAYAMAASIEVVASNHDDKHVRWRKHEKIQAERGKKNPMQPLPETSLEQHALLTDEALDWLRTRPTHLCLDGAWFAVHAGFEPGLSLTGQERSAVIRVRYVDPKTGLMVSLEEGNPGAPTGSVPWFHLWETAHVVHGHAVVGRAPRVYEERGVKVVGIDTGCCYGGSLSAAILEDGELVGFESVPARKVYWSHHIPGVLR